MSADVVRGVFGQVLPVAEYPRGLLVVDARRVLLAAGLSVDELEAVTGFGLRSGCRCLPVDSRVNKYAAGALSIHGVMGDVFGSDSVQHHRGHNLEPGQVGSVRVVACGSGWELLYLAGVDSFGAGVVERVCYLPTQEVVCSWLRNPPVWFGDPVAAVLKAAELRYWPAVKS